ncbi:threonine/serine exporter family protein [Lactobacillus sp. PV034]|uniref:threonine/serine exporter family protein n=1 Tax=Lactobacillus sp. PV034 TaxID=2594495 RepID=UPI00223F19A6|nr:threonine/serine exporter family protein [Lactobacillus sp. PV034]QNQ81280.1 threonine/serine exporter [Lactobacillus sp. PV034]
MPYWLEIIINFSFAWVASVGFALIINVPHRALLLCGLSGAAGWMAYWWDIQFHFGRLGSNLLGALVVGILGIFFARIKKCPVTVFNIPGIVPLVPGVPAYQAVRAMVEGKMAEAEDLLLKVAIVAIAIAMGFMLAQMVGEVFFRIINNRKKKKNLL